MKICVHSKMTHKNSHAKNEEHQEDQVHFHHRTCDSKFRNKIVKVYNYFLAKKKRTKV